jgi:integrase
LGTANGGAAQIWLGKIERALAEGSASSLWKELTNLLPPETVAKLAAIAGYKPMPEAPHHTWAELESKFKAWMTQRGAARETQPSTGLRPFKAAELTKLREAADRDLLAFLLLRWTGLRGSDVVGLRWGEIDWETREINRLTQKRRKRVILPIHHELFFALEVERDRRNPQPEDRVLLSPETNRPLTGPRLYQRMLALGRRAEVLDAHPHRFRDSFAVDLAWCLAVRCGEALG